MENERDNLYHPMTNVLSFSVANQHLDGGRDFDILPICLLFSPPPGADTLKNHFSSIQFSCANFSAFCGIESKKCVASTGLFYF